MPPMPSFPVVVTIKAPQAKVFEYLADISRHGEWGTADDRMKISAEKPGAPAVGARYQADALLNGKQNKSAVTITALESPKRVAFDAEDSNSVFHHEFILTPEGDGTRFEHRVTMTKWPLPVSAGVHDLQEHRGEALRRRDAERQGQAGVGRLIQFVSAL